jgi:hypothetical protein
MVLESGEVVSFGEWGGSGSLASGLLVVLCFVQYTYEQTYLRFVGFFLFVELFSKEVIKVA